VGASTSHNPTGLHGLLQGYKEINWKLPVNLIFSRKGSNTRKLVPI
jgi:hypothetical protein